jgi:hypothetical protein
MTRMTRWPVERRQAQRKVWGTVTIAVSIISLLGEVGKS